VGLARGAEHRTAHVTGGRVAAPRARVAAVDPDPHPAFDPRPGRGPVSDPVAEVPSTAPVILPDDGGGAKFHLATLAFQRAIQLKNGARPRVETNGHGPIQVALLEVRAGLIAWETLAQPRR
jgi:DNA-directed RNA polymerase subunit K/omega